MQLTKLDTATHEILLRVEDHDTGLLGFIAVHSTRLGPAIGGTRFRPYPSEAEAIADVLNLSQGMTCKTAIADLRLGGGKAVILGDPARQKTPALLRAYGRAVETLNGAYWTAEDMGTGAADMEIVAETTRFVTGREGGDRASGDPALPTSQLVFDAIGAAAQHLFGSSDLSRCRVAVQGLGHVGSRLAHHLSRSGAALVLSDTAADRAADLARRLGAAVVAPKKIYSTDADIFAPCAIGGILNAKTIPQLKVRAVVGSANNQLATPKDGQRLKDRGILFGPDYVVNAGGVISAATEILRIQDRDTWMATKLQALRTLIGEIFATARERDAQPELIADQIVQARLDAASGRSWQRSQPH